MHLLLFFTMTLLLGLAVGHSIWLTVSFSRQRDSIEAKWEKRESEWRQRERDLVDRLLRKSHVEPLQIERANVLTVDNDPTPDKSPIDEAMELDAIKEELEQVHAEVTWMTPLQAKASYPREWAAISDKMSAQQRPLRAD